MSIGFALAWLWLSTWLALPWLAELSLLIGVWPAWMVIGGIALLPGFMNAFLVSTLLTAQRGPSHLVAGYPGVSVLVAAYNEAGNIAASLRSLCETRYPGAVELIVIDDGSSDGTAAIVRTRFPQVVLIEQGHNQGKAAALNRGLAIASHAITISVDADSLLHPDALVEIVREYLGAEEGTAAVAGAVYVENGAAGWVSRLQYWDYFHGIAATKRLQAAYGGTLVAQGAFSLYRTDLLREIGGWPSCVGEDIVVTWALLKRGYEVGYAENALCFTNVPDTLGTLIRQRARWARGMIEAFRHHPEILVRPRLITFLIVWNLVFPFIDVAFTFCFIPGLILAMLGKYWIVGPLTLGLAPSAFLLGSLMYRTSAQVFRRSQSSIAHDPLALVLYTMAYGLISHPASLRGYAAELFGLRKTWGTK